MSRSSKCQRGPTPERSSSVGDRITTLKEPTVRWEIGLRPIVPSEKSNYDYKRLVSVFIISATGKVIPFAR